MNKSLHSTLNANGEPVLSEPQHIYLLPQFYIILPVSWSASNGDGSPGSVLPMGRVQLLSFRQKECAFLDFPPMKVFLEHTVVDLVNNFNKKTQFFNRLVGP